MSRIKTSLHGPLVGLDFDNYLTAKLGAKFPALWLGPSGSEVNSMAVNAASTAANIPAAGTATLGSTAAVTYNLAAPIPGVSVSLVSIGSSTGTVVSSTSVGATIVSTGSLSASKATFTGIGQSLDLIGLSTTQYGVLANVGAVALTT